MKGNCSLGLWAGFRRPGFYTLSDGLTLTGSGLRGTSHG